MMQDAGVTFLGTVPSLVKTWKNSNCMEGLDWSKIRFGKLFNCFIMGFFIYPKIYLLLLFVDAYVVFDSTIRAYSEFS
jgi:hypothetical protein